VRNTKIALALLAILVALVLISGVFQPVHVATAQQQTDTQQHSFVDITSKWPSSSIYVCWDNPETKYQREMDIVREAVRNSWEAASSLRFTGWQKCAVQNRGIRITIDDSGPHTKGLGRRLDGIVAGMVLNFTFKEWGERCQDMLDFCIKSISVHEFGHAIGFAHEQNRPDTPGECDKPAQGSNGTAMLTPYDPNSVMNYCNPKYNNNGQLSKYDTETVQTPVWDTQNKLNSDLQRVCAGLSL
jgi:hypothetical protein